MIAEVNNRDVLITREVYANGKSLAKVDGEIVSLGELNKLARKIADIHGQYDNQYLLHTANHIKLIDSYEANLIRQSKEKVAELYQQYMDVSKRLQELEEMTVDNERRKDYMQFQIFEISEANLVPGEDARLEDTIVEMQHREEIYSALALAYNNARETEYNAADAIMNVVRDVKQASHLSKDAAMFEDEFSDIYYRFDDLCSKLREARDSCTISTDALDEANDRLYLIRQMKKKYGDTIEAILEHKENLEKELRQLQSLESDIESVALEKKTVESLLEEESLRLTNLRRTSASTLENKIQQELFNLNFSDVLVSVDFKEKKEYSPDGRDDVEFLISTNKGERLKPLNKIASGGEMSRIMLAFKMIIADFDNIPTMIFDEIDAGISGETAVLVGKAIKQLGEMRQVITITHLPQIAAYGDHNYRISKTSDDSSTYTTITQLSDHEKAGEVARLIAGLNISDLTLQNAMEMIDMTKMR
jgi:DNA repair protein RecN (Recombination protein N)